MTVQQMIDKHYSDCRERLYAIFITWRAALIGLAGLIVALVTVSAFATSKMTANENGVAENSRSIEVINRKIDMLLDMRDDVRWMRENMERGER